MGWRQLKDVLKPAWILGFTKSARYLFPHLFPRFGFDTSLLDYYYLPVARQNSLGQNHLSTGLKETLITTARH